MVSKIKIYFLIRHNDSPTAPRDFWRGRTAWEPTWNRGTEDSFMQVDYVRVRAL